MDELHNLVTPNKEQNKEFLDMPVVGFGSGRNLKDYQVKAKLPKLEDRRCEPCGKEIACSVIL